MKGEVVWVKALARAKRVGRLLQCKRDRGGIADAPLLTVPPFRHATSGSLSA